MLNASLEEAQSVRTTWQPPALPPAISSQTSLILPVSGSIARDRTKSLTVSLIAFSGATPYRCKQIEMIGSPVV